MTDRFISKVIIIVFGTLALKLCVADGWASPKGRVIETQQAQGR